MKHVDRMTEVFRDRGWVGKESRLDLGEGLAERPESIRVHFSYPWYDITCTAQNISTSRGKRT